MAASTKAKRSAAAKKAARTRKKNWAKRSASAKAAATRKRKAGKGKKGGGRKKFKCPGTEKTRRKDGKWEDCAKTHDVASFYAAQKIALSEGLPKIKLEKEIGKNGIAFKTGTALGVFDIGAYRKKKLEFYEIKPRNPKTKADRFLKPDQKEWAIRVRRLGIITKMVYYDERNFVFYHSKPILLTEKNIEQYSEPDKENKKAKKIQKIPCTKLFSDQKVERYCKDLPYRLTGHSVKIIRKIDRLR